MNHPHTPTAAFLCGTIHDLEQGTHEWHQARLGKVTASCICEVIARTKTGWGASRANYAARLVAERLTGQASETYQNDVMRRGNEVEPQARLAYAFFRDAELTRVGFVDHPTIPLAGASPDAFVGAEGLVEIKCPNTATHIDTLLARKGLPDKYQVQMQWQMACTGRQWADFVSFDPRMPASMQMLVRRVHRDPARIAELEALVREFLAEVAGTVSELVRAYEGPGADVEPAVSVVQAQLRASLEAAE